MKTILFIVFFLFSVISFPQKTLDLTYISIFGKEKIFQFFVNREFSYRLKGELFYRTHTLTNMQDSFLVFDNDEIIKLDQIRSVRVKGARIAAWFYKAGLAFFAIDVGNNALSQRTIVNERALAVLGICAGMGAIVNYFQDKHIRITKNCTFRIIEHDFPNLNASR